MTLHLKISDRVIVKKNSRRIFKAPNGRVIIAPSLAYEKFKRKAKAEIMSQCFDAKFINIVHVDYTFYLKGKMDSDLDNIIASVNDILMDAGILEDDSQICSISATKIPNRRDFETQIEIQGS
jgi:Holliday junction resolvase RusA-like endonuclease